MTFSSLVIKHNFFFFLVEQSSIVKMIRPPGSSNDCLTGRVEDNDRFSVIWRKKQSQKKSYFQLASELQEKIMNK